MKYQLSILRGACAVLVLGSGLAIAQEATVRPADANKDNIVTRQEYMDYMGKTWDEHHSKMMKADKKMRADGMTSMQFDQFNKSIYLPDGRVDAGKVGGK